MSARQQATIIAWSETWRAVFPMAGAEWTPPANVRITYTKRGAVARAAFITREGTFARAMTQLRRAGGGKWVVADHAMHLVVHGSAR